MKSTNLHIKNMVCPRCILVVTNELTEMGAEVTQAELGLVSVNLPDQLTNDEIDAKLREFGFELLTDKEFQVVEQIKIEALKYLELLEKNEVAYNLSEYLIREIGKNYSYLSKLYSKHENTTIENYYISRKVKRVKELLSYNELTLSEIAIQLSYSSVHYLSSQFKRVTGQSVSDYKKQLQLILKTGVT
ncbi:MAG: helix-turn-helix transcriptional regulator [Bacteroidetes bacterium]|nr:helix-turn-helix transcriptional regulator [Bacteroidota bacterium]